jgi:hypothetical protein
MSVSFEKVIDGINRYIDKNIYSNLNPTQEFLARIVVGRFNQNADTFKKNMMQNGFMKTLCIIDSEGMVDVDSLFCDIKREVERQNGLQIDIPYIGKLKFCVDDVDALKREIIGGMSYDYH